MHRTQSNCSHWATLSKQNNGEKNLIKKKHAKLWLKVTINHQI